MFDSKKIIIICSSYIALFLAEASSKCFTYYHYPLPDLLHPSATQLAGEYTPAYMLQCALGNLKYN